MSHFLPSVALLDVNVLCALADPLHTHFGVASSWFLHWQHPWALCPLTEAGFLRVASNPRAGARSLRESQDFLEVISSHPGFIWMPMKERWVDLAAPLSPRIFGHQQITDAYLLGLAIANRGTLVTLDRAFLALAGPEYRHHVQVLS